MNFFFAAPCHSQCNDELLKKANANIGDYTFVKDFKIKLKKMEKNKPIPYIRSTVILNQGSKYRVLAAEAQEYKSKLIYSLYTSDGFLMGSSYSAQTKKHYNGIDFDCKQTGAYYITFYFEDGKEGCAVGVLTFKLPEKLVKKDTSNTPAVGSKGEKNTKQSPFIEWSENVKLDWEDFKGEQDPEERHIAYTEYALKLRYSTDALLNNFVFKVNCNFDRQSSWKKKGVTENLLQHEKGHFDIAEIHARLLRKQLSEIKKFDMTMRQKINIMKNQSLINCDAQQKQYDKETEHSKNIEKQKLWEIEIKKELDKLKKYQAPKDEVAID